MARDWKIRSGFALGFGVKSEHFNPDFIRDYKQYRAYAGSKSPRYIRGTDEELIMDLCKTYHVTPDQAWSMKLGFVKLHQLMVDMNNFLFWHANVKEHK